jgi:hypothetical protein
MKRVPIFEEMQGVQSAADKADRAFWFNSVVFSYQWWILVGLTMIPYIVWWKVVDRKRFFEIATYGLLIMMLSGLLDAIGVETDAWDYKYDLVPLLDVFIVYDISVLPVSYMLIYQYFYTWQSFAIAHAVLAVVFAFLSEPLLTWLDIYQPIAWNHTYSAVGYFCLAMLVRWIMGKLLHKIQAL